MKRLYLFVLIQLISLSVWAQKTNCTQVLRLVRSTYESGRLHEIEGLVGPCLADESKGFTNEERRETYRYLTLTYIYLEEPDKADQAMLNLLKTDHFFQINPSLDPAEFVALYKKFRTEPVFRASLKFGLNASQPTVQKYYNIGSAGGGLGKFGISPTFQAILGFEKDIPKTKLTLAPELGFINRKYTYNNPTLALSDATGASVSSLDYTQSQSFLDFVGIVHYKFTNTIQVQTYAGGGPGLSYMLSSSNQATTILGNDFTIAPPTENDKVSFNALTYSVVAVAGGRLKFGEIYVMGEVRYQYGLSNMVNPDKRTWPNLAFNNQIQHNDYRLSTIMVNVGVVVPYFNPKKLIK
ncbi:MAG TPA: outer membrane beta-barrel protein [Cyclobacteriaceae bacterium]|nr:outer membrane beta-barrel protein [Cyclobacteriaceae bacterium]